METVFVTQSKSHVSFSLDSLAAMQSGELESLYRSATAPASMRTADGPLKGRMLAVRGVETYTIARPIRAWAASTSFVWEGKTFTASSDRAGTGINRVSIPGVLGRQNLFPFVTRFDGSVLDGREALILDYDLAENPSYIRHIHDEVREVSPGMLLGPAMWKGAQGVVTVLWFALDTGRR